MIHPRFLTPFNATLLTGCVGGLVAFFADIELLSDMASIGTLFAFTLVSSCTLTTRYLCPDNMLINLTL